jgi:very-short-patch-repair endonuclease
LETFVLRGHRAIRRPECDGGQRDYRLDFAYPHARVAIEYDGRAFHEGDRAERADADRREWLRRHGWTVIVLTKESFSAEAIRRWTNEVRTALGLVD